MTQHNLKRIKDDFIIYVESKDVRDILKKAGYPICLFYGKGYYRPNNGTWASPDDKNIPEAIPAIYKNGRLLDKCILLTLKDLYIGEEEFLYEI